MKKRILYSGALFIGLVSVQSGFAQKKKQKLLNGLILFLFWPMTWATVI